VTFRITPADYGAGVRRIALTLLPMRVFLVATGVAAIAGVAAALIGYPTLASLLFLLLVVYVLTLVWLLFIKPGLSYQRHADMQDDQTYCFSDADVSMTFGSGDSRLRWSYFIDLLETKHLYVLRHPLKQLGTIIPKRAFTGPDAEARFRRLAQQIGRSQPAGPPPA
jgi:hypothetical protein